MSGLVHSRVVPLPVVPGMPACRPKPSAQPTYGVVLLDRLGNLLGASRAPDMPGEVGMPPGIDLRTQDLRRYLAQSGVSSAGRRFSLVSATWLHVRGKRVRVGIYVESGGRAISPERLEPDTGSVVAILSDQVVD